MVDDPIFQRLTSEKKSRPAMVTVAFRIPQEIAEWAKELASTLNDDRSVPLRELLLLGWQRRKELMIPETEDGQRGG